MREQNPPGIMINAYKAAGALKDQIEPRRSVRLDTDVAHGQRLIRAIISETWDIRLRG